MTKALVAVLVVLTLAGATTATGSRAIPTTTVTFNYTGAPQSWTVPAGVTQATFDVYGAQGGGGGSTNRGGQATATLTVTPGQTLQINVGGAGGSMSSTSGGWNGGGPGAPGFGGPFSSGGGGGGASDVRSGACAGTLSCGLASRIVIAGGGGGSGGASGGGGGAGGGSSGSAGSAGVGGAQPGGGGTQSAGGSGGGGSGGAGALGQGGAGSQDFCPDGGGGGGGGGYWGGGGGRGNFSLQCDGSTGGGGGGGGSGFGPAGVNFQTGVRAGQGLVEITYGVPTAVAVSRLSARRAVNVVTLSWRTASEADVLGFHVWRRVSTEPDWTRVTRALVAAKHAGRGRGGRYLVRDRRAAPGRWYVYGLQIVKLDGTRVWGPIARARA